MQEVGCNHVRGERGVLLLEDDSYDVVADVPLSLQLLTVVVGVGQESRHMEHDLLITESLVHRLGTCLPKLSVQASSITEK